MDATHRSTTGRTGPGPLATLLRGCAAVCAAAAAAGLGAACTGSGTTGDTADDGGPTIVVTTGMLGDVVSNMVGDHAQVEVIMPSGASPHEFAPSARQAATMRSADVLVTNGAGFEAGLDTTIESARSDGTPVCTAIDGVDTLPLPGAGPGGGAAHRGEHGDGSPEDHHRPGAVDPHFFTDPSRMAGAVDHLADCMADAVPALAGRSFAASTARYSDELDALDDETRRMLSVVPEQRRKLVTSHEVFQYFADRYDFEVVGAIIPSTSTQSEPDAANLKALTELIRADSIPAVFVDASSSQRVADSLAAEAGRVEVVTIFGETLGPDGDATYIDTVRTNTERIADALG